MILELTGNHENGSLLMCTHSFIKDIMSFSAQVKMKHPTMMGKCSTKGSVDFASGSKSFTKRLTFVQYLKTKNSLTSITCSLRSQVNISIATSQGENRSKERPGAFRRSTKA